MSSNEAFLPFLRIVISLFLLFSSERSMLAYPEVEPPSSRPLEIIFSVAIIFLTNTDELIFYLPFLLISGTIAGVVIGLISGQTVNKMKKFQF